MEVLHSYNIYNQSIDSDKRFYNGFDFKTSPQLVSNQITSYYIVLQNCSTSDCHIPISVITLRQMTENCRPYIVVPNNKVYVSL